MLQITSVSCWYSIFLPIWLVVSTHLKNISQIGSFPQVGVKIKNVWNHHLAMSFTNPPHSRRNSENAPKEDDCLRIDWGRQHQISGVFFGCFHLVRSKSDTHGLDKSIKEWYDHSCPMYKHSSLFLLGESHIKPIHCKSKGLLANSQSHSRKGLKFGVTKQSIFAWKRGPFGVQEICIFLLLQKAYWFGRCGGP